MKPVATVFVPTSAAVLHIAAFVAKAAREKKCAAMAHVFPCKPTPNTAELATKNATAPSYAVTELVSTPKKPINTAVNAANAVRQTNPVRTGSAAKQALWCAKELVLM